MTKLQPATRPGTPWLRTFLGLEVESASIVPDEDSGGWASVPYPEDFEAYGENAHEVFGKHLVVDMAGVKAVEILTGRPTALDDPNLDPRILGTDWDRVSERALRLAGPTEESQLEVQDRASEKAEAILHENWNVVEALAEALLEEKELDRGQVLAVFATLS